MSNLPNDYLGMIAKDPEDAEQSGVKGMKWGVRRDRSTLKAAAAKRAASSEKTPASTTAPKHDESAPERYARLSQVAKEGRASELSDADLKFYNARSDAIAKINKMNQEKPGWLQKTAKDVAKATAMNTMTGITTSLANKYIGQKVTEAIDKQITKGIAKATAAAATRAAMKAAT